MVKVTYDIPKAIALKGVDAVIKYAELKDSLGDIRGRLAEICKEVEMIDHSIADLLLYENYYVHERDTMVNKKILMNSYEVQALAQLKSKLLVEILDLKLEITVLQNEVKELEGK